MDLIERVLQLEKEIHSIHMKCAFKLLEKDNIHPGQPAILKTINKLGNCNQCELAKVLGTSPASVGVSIKRLEKCGYVVKKTDEKDSRSNVIYLTEEGKNITRVGEKNMEVLTKKTLEGFSEEEILQLIGFLKKIYENINNYQKELYKGE